MNEIPKKIFDENNGLTYTLHGDYYLPDIEASDKKYNFSRFRFMYFDYLKKHRPILFTNMLISGTLYEHMQTIDRQAEDRYNRLMDGYIRCWRITEELKATDQMKWVGLMNLARAGAEHSTLSEMIFQ